MYFASVSRSAFFFQLRPLHQLEWNLFTQEDFKSSMGFPKHFGRRCIFIVGAYAVRSTACKPIWIFLSFPRSPSGCYITRGVLTLCPALRLLSFLPTLISLKNCRFSPPKQHGLSFFVSCFIEDTRQALGGNSSTLTMTWTRGESQCFPPEDS